MAKITIHTPEEIEAMRRVGAEAADLLDFITPHVKAGVSTLKLDELMLEYTVNVLKAKSACLGYNPGGNGIPYPRATCISVNNVICHGIPSEKKILKNGDIVNIDVTIEKDGFFGDNSRMFIIGKPTIAGKRHIMDLNDGWTVVTKDRSLSAQWELEVVVTETGYDILTVSKGMPEPPTWVKGWKKPCFE